MARTKLSARKGGAKKPRVSGAKKPSKREVTQKFIQRLRSDSPLNPEDISWILQQVVEKMEKRSLTFPVELMSRVDEVQEVSPEVQQVSTEVQEVSAEVSTEVSTEVHSQLPKMVIISQDLQLTIIEDPSLNDFRVLQSAIGGHLEYLSLQSDENGLSVYCDENGRFKYGSTQASESMRQRLSALFGCASPSVVGPILIVNTDAEGNTVGLIDEQLEKIREHFP
jgi:hypothetical protein